MKGFFNEFKEFITQGNLMEIACGLLLATAFNNLITSFSNTFLLPIINKALKYAPTTGANSGVEFAGVQINYGAFITDLISFLITGLVLFIMIKLYGAFLRKNKTAQAHTEISILLEIRDLLKKK